MKKKIILISLISFLMLLLTGCTSVQKMSLDDIIRKETETNVTLYNKYRHGYKYYLPKGIEVVDNSEYNEVLMDENYKYFLYIDAVSQYNKVIELYEVSEAPYVSMAISYKDRYGYLEINELDNDKYFIEIMYNYAKIEVIVKKKDINLVVANSLIILNSVQFDNNILKSLLDEEISQFNEFEFNIFETNTDSKNETDFLQTLDGDVYEEPEVHDSDLIN